MTPPKPSAGSAHDFSEGPPPISEDTDRDVLKAYAIHLGIADSATRWGVKRLVQEISKAREALAAPPPAGPPREPTMVPPAAPSTAEIMAEIAGRAAMEVLLKEEGTPEVQTIVDAIAAAIGAVFR